MAGGPGEAREARGRARGAKQEIKRQRLTLPWVPVEKQYEFDTEDGEKTLAELFEGRTQLLAYNVMFGPDYTLGACPGCTSLADGLDGSRVHLNHLDVTLICFSRAPIERLTTYKQRMGWDFPYVSTYNTDFAFDFGLALSVQQADENPEIKQLVGDSPEWLEEWSRQIGADLKDGLRENPSWIAFARENGSVYHTYPCRHPIHSSRRTSASWLSGRRRSRRATLLAKGRVSGLTVMAPPGFGGRMAAWSQDGTDDEHPSARNEMRQVVRQPLDVLGRLLLPALHLDDLRDKDVIGLTDRLSRHVGRPCQAPFRHRVQGSLDDLPILRHQTLEVCGQLR